MSANLKKHWPLIPLTIGASALGVGVAFGAADQWVLPAFTSNLPMVLALCGASLAVLSALVYNFTYFVQQEKDKLPGVLGAAGVAALVVGAGYATVHLSLAPDFLGAFRPVESLGIQAGIGFGIGFVPTFLLSYMVMTYRREFITPLPKAFLIAFTAGVCVAASAATGPALVAAIGTTVAADATQALALEATVSVAIGAVSLLFILGCLVAGRAICGSSEKAADTDVS